MYLSIHYTNNNIYLYKKDHRSLLCKKNHSYILDPNKYNKLIFLTTQAKNNDIIKLYENSKIPISFNSNWSISKDYIVEDSFQKSILIPPSDLIENSDTIQDINSINNLCQDDTRITHLPTILCYVKDKQFIFSKWTGFCQTWSALYEDPDNLAYAYLYFFKNKSIFMVSIREKNINHNHFFDLDIMSVDDHPNLIHDEFNRINCSEHYPKFSQPSVLQSPISQNITENSIKILTQYL